MLMISACVPKLNLYRHYWTMDVNTYLSNQLHVVGQDSCMGLPCKVLQAVNEFRFGDVLFMGDSSSGGKSISFLFEDEKYTLKAGLEIMEVNPVNSPRNQELLSAITGLLGTNVNKYTNGKDLLYIWNDLPDKGKVVAFSLVHGYNKAGEFITTRVLMLKRDLSAFDSIIDMLKADKKTI
ncbi:hypothetical protein DF182_01965 [Chitinophaga flava]|uniref:Uncharacterized protein n=2 Tax=Chitinophaga flava TaxID=2259036 RepID=A0A365XYE7_9BACT|nr:hypothetical protein DF182_01965 [Chitinophaga flava]